MSRPEYSAEEIARLGEEIYARDIREKVEHEGEFLVVDVTTGSYELDTDEWRLRTVPWPGTPTPCCTS